MELIPWLGSYLVSMHGSRREVMKSRSIKETYTLRTSGALPVQLEFDFGPDFARVQGEREIETNSCDGSHANHEKKAGSVNARRTTNDQ